MSLCATACGSSTVDICTNCRVDVEQVGTLGYDTTTGQYTILHALMAVSASPDGRVFVVDAAERGVIKVFGRNFAFIRSAGRYGHGPGEYIAPRPPLVRARDGRILVIDPPQGRLTVLSNDLDTVLATHPWRAVPTLFQYAQLREGRLIVNGVSFSDAQIGLPLHMIGADGELLKSFGADPPISDLWDSGAFHRSIAVAANGDIWVAHRDVYQIEQYDPDGNHLRTFRRAVDWFKPAGFDLPKSPKDEPGAHIAGIHVDSAGVWVAVNLAADNWHEFLERKVLADGQVRFEPALPVARYWKTRLELLNLATGELLTSAEHYPSFDRILPGGLAYDVFTDEHDAPLLRLWRFSLISTQEAEHAIISRNHPGAGFHGSSRSPRERSRN
jgi:hypothetical protein